MSIGITDLAHGVRKASSEAGSPISLSHAQQLVCAALGHNTLASFQASVRDEREPADFDESLQLLPDFGLAADRARELGLQIPHDDLRKFLALAFETRAPRVRVHQTAGEQWQWYYDSMTNAVVDDESVSNAMANANYDGIDEVYFEEDVEFEQGNVDEPYSTTVAGHVSLSIDTERPYAGHKVHFELEVTVERIGRCVLGLPQFEVLSAGMDYDWGPDDRDTARPPTLAEEFARRMNIDLVDAEQLVDTEPLELTGHSGEMTYSYLYDFAADASPELAARLMEQHGSLQLEVELSFFDLLRGADGPDA